VVPLPIRCNHLTHPSAPVTTVASFLSYSEIKKFLPWLARLIDASPRLAAIVQNSLPSLTIIIFNGLLPFILMCMSLFHSVFG
jgi:hypothetical protein